MTITTQGKLQGNAFDLSIAKQLEGKLCELDTFDGTIVGTIEKVNEFTSDGYNDVNMTVVNKEGTHIIDIDDVGKYKEL